MIVCFYLIYANGFGFNWQLEFQVSKHKCSLTDKLAMLAYSVCDKSGKDPVSHMETKNYYKAYVIFVMYLQSNKDNTF